MTVVLGPTDPFGRERHICFAVSDWLDTATLTASLTPEAGTVLTDLVTRQPQDVVGFDVSAGALTLFASRAPAAPIDVVALLRTNATSTAEWFVGVGESDDEAAGNEAFDASGHGRHGAFLGSSLPIFQAGVFGGGLRVGGGSGPIVTPENSLGPTGITYMGYFAPDSVADLELISHDVRVLQTDSTGHLTMVGGSVLASSPLQPYRAQHIAVTISDPQGDVVIYLDGEIVSAETDFFLSIDPAVLQWGATFEGWMDELRCYDRVLTQAEIQFEMQAEAAAPYDANLQVYYRLNAYQTGDQASVIPFGAPPNDPDAVLRDGVIFLPYAVTVSALRIFIQDPDNPLPLRIGRAFAGTKLVPSKNFDWGYEFTAATATKKTEAPSGTRLTVERPVHEGFRCDIKHLTRTEALGDFYQLRQQLGTARDLLLCADPGDDAYLQAQLFYCQFTELMTLTPDYYNGWRVAVAVEALG